MRKRFVSFISILLFLFIVGCGNEDGNVHDADFQGVILEVKENSIIVGEDDIDPEAQYPTYEVNVDDNTIISGLVENFEDLDKMVSKTNHPIVHVWVMDKGVDNEIDNRVARKVIVEKE